MMKYVTYICKKLKEYNAIKDVFDKNEDGWHSGDTEKIPSSWK